ncbi:winged helix-turn-helix domain-containing protein [Enterococcus raffinosus]|uniref:winged helix-turn-helix domain-containing protein n=1 Tax=Enterococcus raffinosus TaxID=71452 RepID=UPI000764229B|nr:helix-turn-helix domain-containing protein [Enterococcus raffinosus]
MKILILTKNLLAESGFQSKLQQLNNEVFCSACLLEDCYSMDQEKRLLFSCFDAVILSETIAYQEIVALMPKLRGCVSAIVRKYESDFTKSYEEDQTDSAIDQWIRGNASLEEIREMCQTINHQDPTKFKDTSFSKEREHTQKKKYHLYHFGLSKRENLLMTCLYDYSGKYLSRQELCEKIWEDEGATNSRMSALSACVRNIKSKVVKSGVECDPINTSWGKGYQISDEFYQMLVTEVD